MGIAAGLFLLGLSFGSGPCFASCGPVVLPYFAQSSFRVSEAVKKYAIFSLGRVIVYCALGVALFLVGKVVAQSFLEGIWRPLGIAGGVVILTMGVLTIFGKKFRAYPCPGKSANLFILGMVMGLSPCGPLLVLLASTALIAKTLAATLGYCFVFGLGTMISPLMLLAVIASGTGRFLEQKNVFLKRALDVICGLIMIFMGIQFFIKARG